MKGYAEVEVFEPFEVDLFWHATALMSFVVDDPALRCHELARAVGVFLGLSVQDGLYGFVEHSWLWTRAPGFPRLWQLPNVLDVYVPGELPQVQLIHTTTALPMPYRPGEVRTDIDQRVVDGLVRTFTDFDQRVVETD